MIDFNSKSILADRINHLIDKQIDATTPASQARGYLGASVVGHHCERAVQFQLLAARGEVERKIPAARIMRIFDRGNEYEEKARQWLIKAGFIFGQQRGFEDFGGQFRGHVDGVIVGWDDLTVECPLPLPALWENKCLGAKSWNKLEKERLKEYSSTYYTQVQLYMHYTGLKQCLFTAVNADTMELYHELVAYNAMDAELARSRVVTVINASDEGRMFDRCINVRNFYLCKMCDWQARCWDE